MVAVSNTSPISNLSIIRRLDLLRLQFSEVLIPDAVFKELQRMPYAEGKASIEAAIGAGWISVQPATNAQLITALENDLDSGEAAAIALATEVMADVLLIDEKEGRRFARAAGLTVRGVLGVLMRGVAEGEVVSMKAEIELLRRQAGFFIAPALEARVLAVVEEELERKEVRGDGGEER